MPAGPRSLYHVQQHRDHCRNRCHSLVGYDELGLYELLLDNVLVMSGIPSGHQPISGIWRKVELKLSKFQCHLGLYDEHYNVHITELLHRYDEPVLGRL